MSLLTVAIVKNSPILTGIYFAFLKERPRPNSKVLQHQIWTLKKRYHVIQISALFYNLVALMLG